MIKNVKIIKEKSKCQPVSYIGPSEAEKDPFYSHQRKAAFPVMLLFLFVFTLNITFMST